MADISASEAIGAGFRVIRRTPWVILAWALTYILLALPQFAIYAAVAPDLISHYQALGRSAHGGAPPEMGEMLAFQQQMMILQPVILLTALLVQTIITGAIYRAVFEPQARRWAYLRLGAQELWLGIASVVMMIMLMLMMFTLVIPVAFAAGMAAAAAHGEPAAGGGLLIGLVVVAGVVAIVWVCLRLSLALPMSFAERRLRIFESWTLTRGHALKMFLVALGVLAIAWILEIVIIGLFWWGVWGLGGFDPATLSTTPAPELLRRLLPAFLILTPIMAVLGMAMFAVMIAPWADMYRQLTRESAAA